MELGQNPHHHLPCWCTDAFARIGLSQTELCLNQQNLEGQNTRLQQLLLLTFHGCIVSVHSYELAKPKSEVSSLPCGLRPKTKFSSHAEVGVVLWVQARLELQSGDLRRRKQLHSNLKRGDKQNKTLSQGPGDHFHQL